MIYNFFVDIVWPAIVDWWQPPPEFLANVTHWLSQTLVQKAPTILIGIIIGIILEARFNILERMWRRLMGQLKSMAGDSKNQTQHWRNESQGHQQSQQESGRDSISENLSNNASAGNNGVAVAITIGNDTPRPATATEALEQPENDNQFELGPSTYIIDAIQRHKDKFSSIVVDEFVEMYKRAFEWSPVHVQECAADYTKAFNPVVGILLKVEYSNLVKAMPLIQIVTDKFNRIDNFSSESGGRAGLDKYIWEFQQNMIKLLSCL